MTLSRRNFLATSSLVAASAILPDHAAGSISVAGKRFVSRAGRQGDPDLHALALHGVDAAHGAGATYADVRLTASRVQNFNGMLLQQDDERFAVGVRTFVDGFWGFCSSAVWTSEEVVRLAHGAVGQAKAASRGATRDVRWDPIPIVSNGAWVMPVKYDPFDIPIGERADFAADVVGTIDSLMDGNPAKTGMSMEFTRLMKVFASSEGSSWTQTTYATRANVSLGYRDQYSQGLFNGFASLDTMTWAGKGWEHISESGIIDRLPEIHDASEQRRHTIPTEVNRYDMVFSAQAMAAVLNPTIGAATELDCAMGYEANAKGTSYLNDPLRMVGVLQVASPLLNVIADRSSAGGAATVRWDDESAVPVPFSLIKNGVLVDFQTTREQAGWLASYYGNAGMPVRSHGCANSESAMRIPMQLSPNLQLVPVAGSGTFESMVTSVKNGVAVMSIRHVQADQQQSGCICIAELRKITNGKLGPYLRNGALMFRALQFWKNLAVLGGESSAQWYGFQRSKGIPRQSGVYSIRAVPAIVRDVSVIDLGRGRW